MTDLAPALAAALGAAAVDGLTRLSGGASRETWAFDAVYPDGGRAELILRRDPPGRPSEAGSMGREARAIGAARAAGLAVPEVLLADDGAGRWGAPGLVMRRVAGETLPRRILRNESYAPARAKLTAQLGAFAAGLHALPAPPDFPAPDPLGELRDIYAQFGWPSPVFELALDRLEQTRPAQRDPVLVHGDLRLGNLIVGPDGLRAVLDWELTHAGSPVEDLGWLCVKAWRFGAPGPAAGVGTRGELLAAYRAGGAAEIGPDELRWWELHGTLRWGLICMRQAHAHLSGAHRSVELAAIGRRVCEQEWDLLEVLAPDAVAAVGPPATTPRTSPAAAYGRPTAAELLDAVRGYLTEDVRPGTEGQLSFHARVAANVLAVVERELAAGPPPVVSDSRDVTQLARNVAARLAVANPRHLVD